MRNVSDFCTRSRTIFWCLQSSAFFKCPSHRWI